MTMNKAPCVLAIDTLSACCTVAVLDSDGALCIHRGSGKRRHASEVLNLVEAVLQDSGLSMRSLAAVATVRGPGSFTGLRIGTSVAQGLAFSTDLPVLSLSSLSLLARVGFGQSTASRLMCLIRARPGEYYQAVYSRGEQDVPRLTDHEVVGGFPDPAGLMSTPVVTDSATDESVRQEEGVSVYGDRRPFVVAVDAATLARLAVREMDVNPDALMNPVNAVPVYLKEHLEYRKSVRPVC